MKKNEMTLNYEKKTKNALLWMSLCNEPFVVLYVMIPFIIRKDLHASLVQLSILSSLKPVLSIFSFYWSANLTKQRQLLRSNLISSWILARLPFVFIPWITNTWYILFSCAAYELLNKSGNPALIELLKINIPKHPRNQIYSLCFVLSFLESIILGFFVASIFNSNLLPWPILFAIAALLGLSTIFMQMKIPLPKHEKNSVIEYEKLSVKIFKPWQEAWKLLKLRPDFFRFQYGFMLGGIGLMLVSPILSLFFVDLLQLSHAKITIGRSILMGIGVTASSFLWNKMLSVEMTDKFLRNILFGFTAYLYCLSLAKINISFFYLAFILYGISQAGSHLLWNLSGSLFSGEEDSSQFSRVNILLVGLRGAFFPALGSLLCHYFGPVPVIIIGGSICCFGIIYMATSRSRSKIAIRL